MADTIRGLTVEIGADASSFNKEMSSMRKAAQSSQTELNALQKSLELKFDADKFAQAQKVAQQAIDQTAANADALRRRLAYLEDTGNIDTDAYRKLQSELAKTELQGQQLQQQLEKINAIQFTQVGNNVSKLGGAISGVGRALTPLSTLAAGAVTGLGALGVTTAATGAEIDDLSLRLGISAEKVQEYQYVTAQCGVEWAVFEKALIKGRAALLDLSTGTVNNASKALQSLGINIADFENKEAMFDGILTALSNMQDKTLQAAYANEIFGDKIANQMLPYLNAGSDAINQFKGEFEQIGALSNEQVAALATLDDTLYLVKQSLKGVAAQIGASLAPLIQRLAENIQTNLIPKLQKLAEWFNGLSVSQQSFALKAMLVVAALAPLTLGIGKLVGAVGNIIKILPSLKAGLDALAANPIILIIAAVVAILILLYTKCEAFREAINNLITTLGEALKPALDAVMLVLDLIMQIIQPIIDLVGGILAVVVNLVSEALQPFVDIINMIFGILQPLFDMLSLAVDMFLMPIQTAISALFSVLQPLLSVALIPIKLCLQALQVPLKVLGTLLGWLTPLFSIFGKVVTTIFNGVVKVINFVLGFIEDAINFVIGIINGLIDGVNGALGWLGVHIDRIAEVKLHIDTSDIESMDDVNAIIDSTPPDTSGAGGGTVYDGGNGGSTYGDTYNYDNSTTNKTQNITVTIQNYAAEVDTDALVRDINIKLAEAM
jgi:phage-related minor tail protein